MSKKQPSYTYTEFKIGAAIPNSSHIDTDSSKLLSSAITQDQLADFSPDTSAAWPFPGSGSLRASAPASAQTLVPTTVEKKVLAPAAHWPFDVAPPDAPAEARVRIQEGQTKKRNLKRLKESLAKNREVYKLEFLHAGRITIAYRTGIQNGKGKNYGKVIEFSTSICHKNDTYAKWVGSALAAQNFEKGAVARVPTPHGYASARDFMAEFVDLWYEY